MLVSEVSATGFRIPATVALAPGDSITLGLAVLATLALWRLKWSVLRVIGVCALAGLLLRWPGLG